MRMEGVWKILHKLFGWDYIYWDGSCDQGVARIHIDGEGNLYYWRYKSIRVLDKIERSEQVTWLTCHPGKYFHSDKIEGYSIR